MWILSRYIVREHVLPFIYSLLVLIFLLFTNFLLRAVDKFLGKGLPLGVILEYLALNTAWIVALAAPMAVLVATLMAFGRLSEDNEIAALRASGVSLSTILWPALAFSLLVAGPLTYFNLSVLPNMNHRARLLSRDIYRKRPDLNVEAGYFIDDLPEYSFIVKGKRGETYQDVRIYSKDRTRTQTSIHAKEGTFSTIEDAILVTLYDGEIHELDVRNYQNYRRIAFEKHRIVIPADDLVLHRRESASRGDREMTVPMMNEKIGAYREKISTVTQRMKDHLEKVIPGVPLPEDPDRAFHLIDNRLDELESGDLEPDKEVAARKRSLSALKRRFRAEYQLLEGYRRSINRFRVEIHKKFSIPAACIVFILVGAPLGMMARRGGFVTAVTFSIGFFLIYWVFLIAGEELADRNLLSPVLAMWSPNLLLGLMGVWLSWRISQEEVIVRIPFLEKVARGRAPS
ncbi:MAG: LptF/LptG family permease [Fidelibacterota bacterium]